MQCNNTTFQLYTRTLPLSIVLLNTLQLHSIIIHEKLPLSPISLYFSISVVIYAHVMEQQKKQRTEQEKAQKKKKWKMVVESKPEIKVFVSILGVLVHVSTVCMRERERETEVYIMCCI